MHKVALFGAGRIGRVHAGNIATRPSSALAAVVDIDANAATTLVSAYDAKTCGADEVWSDPIVGAVVIASSTDTHAELIEQAACAGKDMFCEKPIDLRPP